MMASSITPATALCSVLKVRLATDVPCGPLVFRPLLEPNRFERFRLAPAAEDNPWLSSPVRVSVRFAADTKIGLMLRPTLGFPHRELAIWLWPAFVSSSLRVFLWYLRRGAQGNRYR